MFVPDEIVRRAVPGEYAVRDRDKERVGTLGLEPIGYFLSDPMRCRGLRRGQQDQKARLTERLLYRRPQVRRGGEARVIAKHPQRATLVPGLAERLHRALQLRRDRLVLGVAVGDECVVERHGAAPVVAEHHLGGDLPKFSCRSVHMNEL